MADACSRLTTSCQVAVVPSGEFAESAGVNDAGGGRRQTAFWTSHRMMLAKWRSGPAIQSFTFQDGSGTLSQLPKPTCITIWAAQYQADGNIRPRTLSR
jgi:hypothetical protein